MSKNSTETGFQNAVEVRELMIIANMSRTDRVAIYSWGLPASHFSLSIANQVYRTHQPSSPIRFLFLQVRSNHHPPQVPSLPWTTIPFPCVQKLEKLLAITYPPGSLMIRWTPIPATSSIDCVTGMGLCYLHPGCKVRQKE